RRDRGPISTGLRNKKIIMFRLERQRVQPIVLRYGFDRDAPVRPTLLNRRRHRIVRLGLKSISRWLSSDEVLIDQNPCPAAWIAIDHRAVIVLRGDSQKIF